MTLTTNEAQKCQAVPKFKVWDAGRKEWLHETPFALYGETTLMGHIDRRPDGSAVKCEELKDLVTLQFTGLHDRNGAEIYAGDICRITFNRAKHGEHVTVCRVEFQNGQFCYVNLDPQFSHMSSGVGQQAYTADSEIVGNIYDNDSSEYLETTCQEVLAHE